MLVVVHASASRNSTKGETWRRPESLFLESLSWEKNFRSGVVVGWFNFTNSVDAPAFAKPVAISPQLVSPMGGLRRRSSLTKRSGRTRLPAVSCTEIDAVLSRDFNWRPQGAAILECFGRLAFAYLYLDSGAESPAKPLGSPPHSRYFAPIGLAFALFGADCSRFMAQNFPKSSMIPGRAFALYGSATRRGLLGNNEA